MATKVIILTPAEWAILKPLIIQGKHAVSQLGLPVEIINGDQRIEITSDETKITIVT